MLRGREVSDAAPWSRRRLLWGHGKAVARWDGVSVALAEPPIIAGRRVELVDFCPFVIAQIRYPAEGEREMFEHESRAAFELLRALTGAGTSPPEPASTGAP